jgi:hypothetical protein
MIDVYFCHRDKFCRIASDIGYEIGTRADEFGTNHTQRLLDNGYDVSFVDNNFKDPCADRLVDVAETCDALYAVCPDVDEVDDVADVLAVGDRLTDIGVTPIVVPKVVFDFERIPDDWLLGFSVPSGYGSTDVPLSKFTTHDVHLLGGSPRTQLDYATQAAEMEAVSVVSVDGNAFSKAAGYGNIINTPSELLTDGNAWDYDIDYPSDWNGRVIVSLVRNFLLWRDWSREYY